MQQKAVKAWMHESTLLSTWLITNLDNTNKFIGWIISNLMSSFALQMLNLLRKLAWIIFCTSNYYISVVWRIFALSFFSKSSYKKDRSTHCICYRVRKLFHFSRISFTSQILNRFMIFCIVSLGISNIILAEFVKLFNE